MQNKRRILSSYDLLQNDSCLSEVLRILTKYFKPERIYLFGSKARGENTASSDYDILLVLPHLERPSYEYAGDAYKLLREITEPIDIVFLSRKRFEEDKEVVNTVAEAAYKLGVELYAA